MYNPRILHLLLLVTAFAGTSQSQKSDAEFCASKVNSFFSWAHDVGPTTPAAVLSFLAAQTNSQAPLATFGPSAHGDEICSILSELPPSLIPEFRTYITAVLSFGSANSDVLIGVATDCAPEDQVASITDYISEMVTHTGGGSCHAATPAPGGAANGAYSTSPAPTATSFHGGQGNSTLPTTVVTAAAAAARPTGVLLGAAAAGGLLGFAAML
ncbi:hypothetical protein F4808DRAFT_59314 [Astrocystis sublimbata]|nr:hypothetical protein F4808DRAFT_59314 [Astrocystis sublimbata]